MALGVHCVALELDSRLFFFFFLYTFHRATHASHTGLNTKWNKTRAPSAAQRLTDNKQPTAPAASYLSTYSPVDEKSNIFFFFHKKTKKKKESIPAIKLTTARTLFIVLKRIIIAIIIVNRWLPFLLKELKIKKREHTKSEMFISCIWYGCNKRRNDRYQLCFCEYLVQRKKRKNSIVYWTVFVLGDRVEPCGSIANDCR